MSADEYQISMAGGDGDPIDAIQRRADSPFETSRLGIGQVDADRDYLLALVREQQARIDRVERLADAWEARGESDMAFSKRIPDENIAISILTNGAQMVENARRIRNALEPKS